MCDIGFVLAFVRALRAHGWRVFYRGLSVALVRSVPVSCTVLPMFDFAQAELTRLLD